MNVLFLMTDQLRCDCVGWGTDSKLATPNLDRIAAGAHFSKCQTVNPVCMPARSALLTGRYSHQVGALQMSGDLSRDYPTWPKALQTAGYWTAGIGKFHFLQTWRWARERGRGLNLVELTPQTQEYGFDRVWESAGKQLALKNYCHYGQYLEGKGLLEPFRDMIEARGANQNVPSEELAKDGDAWPFEEEHHVDVVTNREILRALDERPKDQPFAIFGSYCSPHKPFDPPQRFLDRVPYEEVDDFVPGDKPLSGEDKQNLWKLRRAYKATILLLDDLVGQVLDRLEADGLLDQTLIVLSSDHGEMMGDHCRVQKQSFYHQSQQVPLAIRYPGYVQASGYDCPVELTDITATLLDAAGLNPQEALAMDWPAFQSNIPCRSLLPLLRGEVDSVRDYAFSEWGNQWSSLTESDWKYVLFHAYEDPDDPAELLFDLNADPNEEHNLAQSPEHQEQINYFRRRLTWLRNQTPHAQTSWAPLMD